MIHHGDCLEVLKTIEDNSIDSLVTDPPAGIGFMGKSWDHDKGGRKQWTAWMESVMRECIRVMKPGAHGLVWALPRTSHWTATALEDAGFEVRDVITHLFGQGFPKSHNLEKACGAKGQGTALKPASEHWILVRKPISEKTIAANVLEWGCGGLNIDGCRIELTNKEPNLRPNAKNHVTTTPAGIEAFADAPKGKDRKEFVSDLGLHNSKGRFPANLVLSHSPHCTDDQCDIECAIARLDGQSGPCKTGDIKPHKNAGSWKQSSKEITASFKTDAATGASRFFYTAKISPSERGDSNHPTMKTQKLMRYLCRLVTPPAGVILDPFMGSGSTGLAAKSEGFQFVGIEKEEEYVRIAQARIKGKETSYEDAKKSAESNISYGN